MVQKYSSMNKLVLLLLLATCFANAALAAEDEKQLYILNFGATLDLYNLDKDRGPGLAPTSFATAQLTSEDVTLALEADLSHLFENHSLDVNNDDFDWGRFVSEASIKIQNVGDRPVAVIVGKQTIPFGQGLAALPPPFFWNNPTEQLRTIRGVMGVSVEVSELSNFQGIVDQVEISAFESSADWDFDIEGKPAYSIRLTKFIETDEYEHEITTSYARINNGHQQEAFHPEDYADYEERISIGFKTETPFVDDLTLWGEAIYFRGNVLFPRNDLVLSSGIVKQVSEGVFLSGEFSTINEFQKSYAGAVWYRFHAEEGRQLYLGMEYRHTDFDNDLLDDISDIGIMMRLQFYKAKGFWR